MASPLPPRQVLAGSLVMRSRTLVVIDGRENGSREEEKVFHLRRGGAVPVDVWGM